VERVDEYQDHIGELSTQKLLGNIEGMTEGNPGRWEWKKTNRFPIYRMGGASWVGQKNPLYSLDAMKVETRGLKNPIGGGE